MTSALAVSISAARTARLAEGEEMPGRERIQVEAGPREAASRQRRRRHGARAVLAWLVISLVSVTVIAVALALGHIRGGGSCTGWQIPACGGHVTTHDGQSRTFPGLTGLNG